MKPSCTTKRVRRLTDRIYYGGANSTTPCDFELSKGSYRASLQPAATNASTRGMLQVVGGVDTSNNPNPAFSAGTVYQATGISVGSQESIDFDVEESSEKIRFYSFDGFVSVIIIERLSQ